jgi:hypothetical protein
MRTTLVQQANLISTKVIRKANLYQVNICGSTIQFEKRSKERFKRKGVKLDMGSDFCMQGLNQRAKNII